MNQFSFLQWMLLEVLEWDEVSTCLEPLNVISLTEDVYIFVRSIFLILLTASTESKESNSFCRFFLFLCMSRLGAGKIWTPYLYHIYGVYQQTYLITLENASINRCKNIALSDKIFSLKIWNLGGFSQNFFDKQLNHQRKILYPMLRIG